MIPLKEESSTGSLPHPHQLPPPAAPTPEIQFFSVLLKCSLFNPSGIERNRNSMKMVGLWVEVFFFPSLVSKFKKLRLHYFYSRNCVYMKKK